MLLPVTCVRLAQEDWFVLVRVEVTEGRAVMIYEDGNGREHARQEIPYTLTFRWTPSRSTPAGIRSTG